MKGQKLSKTNEITLRAVNGDTYDPFLDGLFGGDYCLSDESKDTTKNGDYYIFISEDTGCEKCKSLNGKIFSFADIIKGENFPPLHPNYKCHIEQIKTTNKYKMLDMLKFTLKKLKQKSDARAELNKILDRQYPNYATVDYLEKIKLTGTNSSVIANYAIGQNIIGKFADDRMNRAMDKIEKNKDNIIKAARQYGIPPELIGAIILKEQYTQSAPDELSIFLKELGLSKGGSTGLGAITAPTARKALKYIGKTNELNGKIVPKDDIALLELLSSDDEFNIHIIAAVIVFEANELDLSENNLLNELKLKDWHRILNKYNGDIEYANKTIEYLPYIKILLE